MIFIYTATCFVMAYTLIEVFINIAFIDIKKALDKAELNEDAIDDTIDMLNTVTSALEVPSFLIISLQQLTLILTIYICLGGKIPKMLKYLKILLFNSKP